jgi:hypothetical protein
VRLLAYRHPEQRPARKCSPWAVLVTETSARELASSAALHVLAKPLRRLTRELTAIMCRVTDATTAATTSPKVRGDKNKNKG